MDAAGKPHPAYYDTTYTDLKYAVDGPKWQVRPLFTCGIDDLPVIDVWQGKPAVALRSAVGSPPNHFLAEWRQPNWTLVPIDVATRLTYEVGLTYDPSGNPHVAYYENGAIRMARWDGSRWVGDVVFDLPPQAVVGGRIDLLWADGGPRIVYAYAHGGFGSLEMAKPDGAGGWRRHSLGIAGATGPVTRFTADVTGRGHPVLAYQEPGGSDLRLARWDGGRWLLSPIDSQVNVTAIALAVDRNRRLDGTPETVAVAYHEGTSAEMRFALSQDGGFQTWQRETLRFGLPGVTGLAVALPENVSSQARVAYINAATNRLMLFRVNRVGLGWQGSSIRPTGGLTRTHVSFAYGDRDRLVYLEGDEAYHIFPTENELTAPADAGPGRVTSETVLNGGLCSFVMDPSRFCRIFEDSPMCRSGTSQAHFDFHRWPMVGTAQSMTQLSMIDQPGLPGDQGVLAGVTVLFQGTPKGMAFLAQYGAHDREITEILMEDPRLLWDGYRTLQDFLPGLEALVQGRGSAATVTQEMAENALSVWRRIRDAAGPELAAAIDDWLQRTNDLQDFVDRSFDDWARAIGVTPPSHRQFLPFVEVPAAVP